MEKTILLKQVPSLRLAYYCLTLLTFAWISFYFAKMMYAFETEKKDDFEQYAKLYNSSTLGYVKAVEKINNAGKKVTYCYQVANAHYENTQIMNLDVNLYPKDKIKVLFDGFDSFDSCIAGKESTNQRIFTWFCLFSGFLCAILAFFHFAIKIYDL